MARSTLVATMHHLVGIATSSIANLQGIAEQALVVVASQAVAIDTAQLWVALAASQLDPHRAATSHPLPIPDTALPPGLHIEEILTP